jgi:hypothetical protein
MNFDSLFVNLKTLWRADRIMADIQLRNLLARSAITAVAMLIGIFALLFFEIAAYFVLVQTASMIAAAALLGAANLVIALILMFIAAKRAPDREIHLVREVHKNAVEAIRLDLQVMQERLSHASRLEMVLPALIPFAGFLLRSLKKQKAPGPQG